MSAVILTPAYSHTHPELERAVLRSGLNWIRLHGHSDLPRVRSLLIEGGLASDAERLLLVDADVVPCPEDLRRLAERADVTPERAVWGLYPMREGDRWAVNPLSQEQARASLQAPRMFPIRSGGLGLCAIHRQSLERLGATLPWVPDNAGVRWRPFCVPILRQEGAEAEYYADDSSLCVRLTESGTALYADPTIQAAHATTKLVRGPRV